MIICTSKKCTKQNECARWGAIDKEKDTYFNLESDCCKATGWDFFVSHKIIIGIDLSDDKDKISYRS